MNKKLFLLFVALPLIVSGCSLSSVPYLNKILPKETVTKIVFQQNGEIVSLADFAKQADALAKEKWAPDAALKTIFFSNADAFMTYVAQFSSDQVKTKEGGPGSMTIYYNYANTGVVDSGLNGIKIYNFSEKENSFLTGVSCFKSALCGNSYSVSVGQQIDPDSLKITSADMDKCFGLSKSGEMVVTSLANAAIPKGSAVLQCGQFRLNAYTDQEIVSAGASSTTSNFSKNNPAISTPAIATTTEIIATSSSQAAIDLNKDSDKDGLPDWQELKYGTNPNNPDTDGDGYTDGAEVASGYNPLGPGKMTAEQLAIKQGIAVQATNAKTNVYNGIIYYYSSTCPDCQNVKKYLDDNKVDQKIAMETVDVSNNPDNMADEAAKVKICKFDNYPSNMPLLWDGTKCYIGSMDIDSFFQDKISKIVTSAPAIKTSPTISAPITTDNQAAPDCAGVSSGELKGDSGSQDANLLCCFMENYYSSNCNPFRLIFPSADLGKITASFNKDGEYCDLKFAYGNADQIINPAKKFYADKYVVESSKLSDLAAAGKNFTCKNISANTSFYYSLPDAGFSGDSNRSLMTASSTSDLNKTRAISRDDLRVVDIKQIQVGLELYYTHVGKYPDTLAFGGSLINPQSGVVYLSVIPQNPLPNDGTCPTDFAFKYEGTNPDKGPSSYKLTYCLGMDTPLIPAGIHVATELNINSR